MTTPTQLLSVVLVFCSAAAAGASRDERKHLTSPGGGVENCRTDWARLLQNAESKVGPALHQDIIRKMWSAAALCAAIPLAEGQCYCSTAASCPQALRAGHLLQCRLPHGGVGLCCPQLGRVHFPGPVGGGYQSAPSGLGVSGTSGQADIAYLPPTSWHNGGPCIPLVLCPPVVAAPSALFMNGCRLSDGSLGIVCTFGGTQLLSRSSLAGRSNFGGGGGGGGGGGAALAGLQPMGTTLSAAQDALAVSPQSTDVLSQAEAAGRQAATVVSSVTSQLLSSGQAPDPNSPTALFFLNAQSTQEAQELGLQALQSLATITNLEAVAPGSVQAGTAFGIDPDVGGAPASDANVVPGCTPEPPIDCSHSRYRTVTGECNNLQVPRLGRSLTGFKRLLPNTYDDGVFAFRTRAFRGGFLPSARLVSERVLDTFSNELRDHTLSLMQFSQFVDHDLTHALVFRLDTGAGIECCLDNGQTLPTTPRHPQCIPIPIPFYDPFYSRFGQRCMSLVRSLPAPDPNCIPRPARPLNELTSFLDASNVYGSQEEELEALRSSSDGLMRTSAGQLLPLDGGSISDRPCRFPLCFRAGDTRVNEQSGLTIMHTIFVREHNRIAVVLKQNHPGWDNEQLFQEARRILTAEWQHIIYNEWLPVVIGFKYADVHGLLPLPSGYSFFYNPNIDPTISNSFATAAFRFGHTLVRDLYDLLDANGQVTRTINLTSTFFEPTVVAESFIEHARTLVARRSEAFDRNVATAIHEQLFTTNFVFGLDLLALNIQRGRDHGTPTYAQVVEACNIGRVQHWGDLFRLMDSNAIDRLRSVYDHPRDVDLFIGGVAERLAPGAQVGPTFQCLIGQQFFDLRYGDRFFYDNGGMPHSFSEAQLREIRRSSWARIMCDTLGPGFGNDFTKVQPLAILTTAGQNQVTSCNSQAIPFVDLSVF